MLTLRNARSLVKSIEMQSGLQLEMKCKLFCLLPFEKCIVLWGYNERWNTQGVWQQRQSHFLIKAALRFEATLQTGLSYNRFLETPWSWGNISCRRPSSSAAAYYPSTMYTQTRGPHSEFVSTHTWTVQSKRISVLCSHTTKGISLLFKFMYWALYNIFNFTLFYLWALKTLYHLWQTALFRTFSVMYDHTFPNLQITRSDIMPCLKWAVSLVIAYGHLKSSSEVCACIYLLTYLLYHSRGYFTKSDTKPKRNGQSTW